MVTPNYKYLVPYSTTLLLYIKISLALTLTALITVTIICKAICNSAISQRLKVTSVYSASLESSPYLVVRTLEGRARKTPS
jgi:hypothetical protein